MKELIALIMLVAVLSSGCFHLSSSSEYNCPGRTQKQIDEEWRQCWDDGTAHFGHWMSQARAARMAQWVEDCMAKKGCQFYAFGPKPMVVGSAGETTREYTSQPVPFTGVNTKNQQSIPSSASEPQEAVKLTITGSYFRKEDIDKLKPGMTEEEVIALLKSHPSRRQKVRDNYMLTWIYYMGSSSSLISLLFGPDHKLIKIQ
jgi:hypothetical protein